MRAVCGRFYPLPWIGLVSLFLAVPATALGQPGAQHTKQPNVLFIFTDDQRADTIAALGNRHIQTPNLDKLVAEGTHFRRAYCMGALQGAVCVPSRAMMLTGKTLFRVDPAIKKQATWP